MKRTAWIAIAVFAASTTIMKPQNRVPADPRASGSLQGTITRAGTSEPIAGADIQLSVNTGGPLMNSEQARSLLESASHGWVFPQETMRLVVEVLSNPSSGAPAAPQVKSFRSKSDSEGRFSFDNVPEGEVTGIVQAQGFFGPPVNGVSWPFAYGSAVVAAHQTSEMKISMIPGAAISGRVTDLSGKPLVNASVGIYRESYNFGRPVLEFVSSKTTDDRGGYRLFALPPGEYLLTAAPRPASRRLDPAERNPVPLLTFYPAATEPSHAIPIAVKGGEELSGISVQVQSAVGTRVSGKVTSVLPLSSGFSEFDAIVILTPHGGAVPPVSSGNEIQDANPEDGSFQFFNVPPGIYDLIARQFVDRGWGPEGTPGGKDEAWIFGRTTIEVSQDSVENVAIVVTPGVDVKGRVLVDGSPSSPALRLSLLSDDNSIRSFDSETSESYDEISRYSPRIEADGTFLIPVVPPGRYRIQPVLALPRGAYVADIRQNGISVYDNGLVVDTREPGPLEVIVNTGGGMVEGTVRSADGKPAAQGVTVVLVPSEIRRQNPNLYLTARTDKSGAFKWDSIPPGHYQIFAWENVLSGAFMNPEFLARFQNAGTSVTVLSNLTSRAEVRVIP